MNRVNLFYSSVQFARQHLTLGVAVAVPSARGHSQPGEQPRGVAVPDRRDPARVRENFQFCIGQPSWWFDRTRRRDPAVASPSLRLYGRCAPRGARITLWDGVV